MIYLAMAQATAAVNLPFLQNSARLLSNQSPSTSAHLMNAFHQSLLRQSNSLTVAQRKDACPACGTLRVPGMTCETFTRPKHRQNSMKRARQRKQKQVNSNTISTTEVVFKCMKCHRETIQRLPKPQRLRLPANKTSQATFPTNAPSASQAISVPQADPVVTETSKAKSDSDNAGSKKRAKARKQQGLLASLSASKHRPQGQQPQTSPALDLLDFFQSS